MFGLFKKKERHFFASYTIDKRFGDTTFCCTDFPSSSKLRKLLKGNLEGELIILNIIEFKNKRDHDSFLS